MGQQQLLLIVLAVILVGAAVILAFSIFKANAIESKRDLLINESAHIATTAITYYKKPKTIGGGGNSFSDWKIPVQLSNTDAGSYNADVSADEVIIIGTGSEVVTGTDSIKVQTTVRDSGYYSVIIK